MTEISPVTGASSARRFRPRRRCSASVGIGKARFSAPDRTAIGAWPCRVCVIAAANQQPSLHVAIVGTFGIGDRQQKPFASVEKSGTKQIGANESPEAVQKTAGERHAPSGRHHLLGART